MRARKERKYALSQMQFSEIRSRLKATLKSDPHSMAKPYHIRSIYFDGPNSPAIWEKLSGTSPRHKYRIRFYNHDYKKAKLECKRKISNHIKKTSEPLCESQLHDILNHRRKPLSSSSLMRQFQLACRRDLLRPVVTVDYYRDAYIYPTGNLRITLDTYLSAGRWQDWKNISHMPMALNKYSAILEVKYTDIYPRFLEAIIPSSPTPLSAISKYVLCRTEMATSTRGLK